MARLYTRMLFEEANIKIMVIEKLAFGARC